MPKTEAIKSLECICGIGIGIGILVIIVACLLCSWALSEDLPGRLDRKGLSNPELIKFIVQSYYLVIIVACFILGSSVATALAGELIFISTGPFWFGH
jgi:hypothetical protein